MYDVGGVHEEQSLADLVKEVLDVVRGQFLAGVYHSMQVGLHEVSDYVDVCVACACLGPKQVHQTDYLLVLEEFSIAWLVLSILISRRMRFASTRSSKALST